MSVHMYVCTSVYVPCSCVHRIKLNNRATGGAALTLQASHFTQKISRGISRLPALRSGTQWGRTCRSPRDGPGALGPTLSLPTLAPGPRLGLVVFYERAKHKNKHKKE